MASSFTFVVLDDETDSLFFFSFFQRQWDINSPAHWSALVDQQARMHVRLHACDAVALHSFLPPPHFLYPPKCEFVGYKYSEICKELIHKNFSSSEQAQHPH